jgi:hypothetical protein
MSINSYKFKNIFSILIIFIILIVAIIPLIEAGNINIPNGYDKGLSYTNVIPTKKTTFVAIDNDNLYDDYAYLAAVPTAVFNSEGKLVSHPLLFYQDKIKDEDEKYKSMDAYVGIDYFMQDWIGYCGKLDEMILINVDESKVSKWKSNNYFTINSDSPFDIASQLALHDWKYSDRAVVAVINEDFKEKKDIVSGSLEQKLPASNIIKETILTTKQTNSLNPISENFEVKEGYKLIKAEAWWDGALILGMMVPTGDPDLQLHFQYDDKWMQAVATADWNVYKPAGHELTQSYVYQPGPWRIVITDFPTETDAPRRGIKGLFEIQGSLLGIFKKKVNYNVDVTMFPGVNIEIPDIPTFGCIDAEFKLKWNNPNVNLGFTLVGPSGEAIVTVINESRTDTQEIDIERLGECLTGEHYQISVFTTDDIKQPIDIKIEYSWNIGIPQEKADSLTSATEGAVLASSLNAPLLYVKPNSLPDTTKEVLYKLGVKKIYLIDIGNHLTDSVKEEIKVITKNIESYSEYQKIYDKIMEISGSNDVIFTTLDPWTYWYVAELKPAGEYKGSLFIGPSAYIAAHHGTPVIIIENHPELSSAAVWHNEFWRRYSAERYDHKPSVAEMVLTGKRIYNFLGKYGFDKEGKETIITVADQYDIGIPWDRIFPGVANSGRFCGSPVDVAFWISRSVFYPALIFENPALKGKVTLETGSISGRNGIIGLFQRPFLNSLRITQQSQKQDFDFPVLCSFVTHKYRFNERASKYYGSLYQCADGLIPGETTTMEPIDQGVNEKYYGQAGMYFPDMTESEVIPFYLEKGGYDTVFSTNFDKVAENLNSGVILWIHASHGLQHDSGRTLFWNSQEGFSKHRLIKIFTGVKHEENPWRGYDWLLGSTEEPDTMTMDMQGIIPFTNHKSLFMPATGMDYVLARKPIREFLVNRPLLGRLFSRFITVDDLYDGLTGTISFSKWPLVSKTSLEMEEQLDNLHSVGFITSICQTSNTYLHMMLIRHGSVFQVQDPWPTSWYGAIWRQSIPRDIILGNTVGEAYTRGISHVGILYLGGGKNNEPQWWWDDAENVVYFGDPDLRMYVPKNEYSTANTWEKTDTKAVVYNKEVSFDGHTPFGAENYPHARQEKTFLEKYLWLIGILILIAILLIALVLIGKKKK